MSASEAVTVSGPGVDRRYPVGGRGLSLQAALGVGLSCAQGHACRTLDGEGSVYVRDPLGVTVYVVERDGFGVVRTIALNGKETVR